jgi:hypothetical protein
MVFNSDLGNLAVTLVLRKQKKKELDAGQKNELGCKVVLHIKNYY